MTQQVDAVVSDEVIVNNDIVRKKVDELSLDEIKNELEKRKLDYSGDDYAILHERLTDSMVEEGLDPSVYEFELEAEYDDDEEEEEAAVVDVEPGDKQVNSSNDDSKTKGAGDTGTKTKSEGTAKNSSNHNNNSSNELNSCSSNNGSGSTNNGQNNNQKKKESQQGSATTKKSTAAQGPQYKEVSGNHLWVSGLSSRCKAADLKKFFARYANVGSAKIVANARTTGAHCYGYITVESPADLEKCVQKLHSTRFEGNLIRVEVCKLAPADQLRKVEMKNRERLAQQKEEFKKRKEERKKRIDDEVKRREEDKRKELEKKREEDRKKYDGSKRRGDDDVKEHKKEERKTTERRRTRSRSPFERNRRPEPFRRQEAGRRPGGGPPPPQRRFNSPPPPSRRFNSPPSYTRGRPRRMSPSSPFGRGLPPPPFMHHGPPIMDRMPQMERSRMMERDRRMEEERFEVERRQRAEADALERERRQLRMEEERLEREKLDLIRLERERVKKEMEEVAARKELAERRRQEELRRQQEEERKREEMRLEMERRPRDPPRQQMPSTAQTPIELYDPRLSMPVHEYGRTQAEDKFAGRLGPQLQRDQAVRHDDRRRDDRRREPHNMIARDERRPPEVLDPWNLSDMKAARGGTADYLDQPRHDPQLGAAKRMRSRSPQRNPPSVPNSGYGMLSAVDYGMGRGPVVGDSWSSQGPRNQLGSVSSSGGFLDSRRTAPMAVPSRGPELQSAGGQWSSNTTRVAFPPAYSHQDSRGLLGGSGSTSFGLGTLPPSGFRRY